MFPVTAIGMQADVQVHPKACSEVEARDRDTCSVMEHLG